MLPARSVRNVTANPVIYFDTGYLVRLSYQEPGADAVRALAATDPMRSAAHGQAEMIAAFHRKLREGVILPMAYAALIGQVQAQIEQGAFYWLAQDDDIHSLIRKRLNPVSASSLPMTRVCSSGPNISASRERT